MKVQQKLIISYQKIKWKKKIGFDRILQVAKHQKFHNGNLKEIIGTKKAKPES